MAARSSRARGDRVLIIFAKIARQLRTTTNNYEPDNGGFSVHRRFGRNAISIIYVEEMAASKEFDCSV